MTMGDSRAAGTSGTDGQTSGAVGQAVDKINDTAGQLMDQAKEQAKPALQSQKERAAGTLGTTADALRKTGQHLREQDQDNVAQYIEQAAERVERFGSYLRGRQVDELVADAERFARRQPGLFIGGAFALGLVAARFLKSSGQRSDASARSFSSGSSGQWRGTYGSSRHDTSGYGHSTSGNGGARNTSASTPARTPGSFSNRETGDWDTKAWETGGGAGSTSGSSSGSAWTSRDERSSMASPDTRGFASPTTEHPEGAGMSSGEATR